jgi:uncharacterized protein YaaQ
VYSLKLFVKDIPLRWQHVLYWGGLRGGLAPALAIGLPVSFGVLRGQIQAMVFGAILFNLLVQGVTLGPLVRRLKLVQRSETQDEYGRRHARAVASRASYAHLESRFNDRLISHHTWQHLEALFGRRTEALNGLGISITRLPSTGGLLRNKNITLLIGLPDNLKNTVIRTLKGVCTQRVEHEGPFDESTPIEIGGAIVFTFDIDRYEEL